MAKSRFPLPFAACALVLGMFCTSTGARAELGGMIPSPTSSSLSAQRTLLNGALRVRTLTDAGTTTINEYATSTGLIVGYAWTGPTMPDLRALLGTYANSYLAGAPIAAANGNLHSSRIARPDVIVESGGPMRGYAGRAWLPDALPPGVTADDLQ
jgi:hypothetical protein